MRSPHRRPFARALPALGALLVAVVCGCDARDAAPVTPADASPADAADAVAGDTANDPGDGGLDSVVTDATDTEPDAADSVDGSADAPPVVATRPARVLTFNVGCPGGSRHNADEDRVGEGSSYTEETSLLVDEHYNNSLSWDPAENRLADWLADQRPDIASFQELFHDPWCVEEDIPVFPGLRLICESFDAARPLQVRRLLGPDYQIACGTRKPDTCLAVHRAWGTMRECPGDDVCVGGLDGNAPPSGCTSRDRAGRVHVDLPDGSTVVIVALHGTSGAALADQECRRDIFGQVFEDRGDGTPLAGSGAALVLGDFNTDPVLFAGTDVSADYIAARVAAEGSGWEWHSPIDPDGDRSYGFVSIDHVVSNAFDGGCVIPGETAGVPAIWDVVYFDHLPVLCDLQGP